MKGIRKSIQIGLLLVFSLLCFSILQPVKISANSSIKEVTETPEAVDFKFIMKDYNLDSSVYDSGYFDPNTYYRLPYDSFKAEYSIEDEFGMMRPDNSKIKKLITEVGFENALNTALKNPKKIQIDLSRFLPHSSFSNLDGKLSDETLGSDAMARMYDEKLGSLSNMLDEHEKRGLSYGLLSGAYTMGVDKGFTKDFEYTNVQTLRRSPEFANQYGVGPFKAKDDKMIIDTGIEGKDQIVLDLDGYAYGYFEEVIISKPDAPPETQTLLVVKNKGNSQNDLRIPVDPLKGTVQTNSKEYTTAPMHEASRVMDELALYEEATGTVFAKDENGNPIYEILGYDKILTENYVGEAGLLLRTKIAAKTANGDNVTINLEHNTEGMTEVILFDEGNNTESHLTYDPLLGKLETKKENGILSPNILVNSEIKHKDTEALQDSKDAREELLQDANTQANESIIEQNNGSSYNVINGPEIQSSFSFAEISAPREAFIDGSVMPFVEFLQEAIVVLAFLIVGWLFFSLLLNPENTRGIGMKFAVVVVCLLLAFTFDLVLETLVGPDKLARQSSMGAAIQLDYRPWNSRVITGAGGSYSVGQGNSIGSNFFFSGS